METRSTPFLRGALTVHQPVRGFRFGIDSVVLAGFSWVREGERVLDLGTGSGILLLLLAAWHHPGPLTGLERDPGLAELARRNFRENGLGDRAEVLEGDLRREEAIPEASFDLVVCNPPYFPPREGRAAPPPERAEARHQVAAGPREVARAARRALSAGGRLCLCFPREALAPWTEALHGAGLFPRLLREVRHGEGDRPYLLLLQAGTVPAPPLRLPPLTLREPGGAYTPEVAGWLGDGPPRGARFLCDGMVGRLAKYLRLLGVDAGYARKAEDDWLLAEAQRTGTVLVTRDRPLLERCRRKGVPSFDPGSDDPRRQLQAFRRAFPSLPGAGPPRCLACNAPVVEVPREEIRGRVPPYTYLTHRRFAACPCCGKLTWEGSHLERFRRENPSLPTE
ncbi:MAG: Mut7-C RNAse domain-containing protein [Acidobacteriota bacterium]